MKPALFLSPAAEAHAELRDVYIAAITAARNFSKHGQSDQSAEAMGLACDATRLRRALEEAYPTRERSADIGTAVPTARGGESPTSSLQPADSARRQAPR